MSRHVLGLSCTAERRTLTTFSKAALALLSSSADAAKARAKNPVKTATVRIAMRMRRPWQEGWAGGTEPRNTASLAQRHAAIQIKAAA